MCNGTSRFLNCLGKSVILEDNASCVAIALDQQRSNSVRTRHIGVKWHNFKDQIKDDWLTMNKVHRSENWSEIFTKVIGREEMK